MHRWQKVLLLILADVLGSAAALIVALWVRGMAAPERLPFPPSAYVPAALLLAAGWVALFAYVGLYNEEITRSWVDELIWLVKAVFFGGVVLFVLTFDPSRPLPPTRIVLVSYGTTLILVSLLGRAVIRQAEHMLFVRGYGGRNALIVGTGARARELGEAIARMPRLGFRLLGYVATGAGEDPNLPTVGTIDELRTLIERHRAHEVMFAEPSLSHETILNTVAQCDGLGANFSAVPDLYDVLIGRSTLGQRYGIPLMPLFPSVMPIWQRRTKRVMDVAVSVLGLALGMPVWAIVALAIWLEDRGPIFYSQERVGYEGRIFRIHKFRSMIPDAEKYSGPVWAKENDPRITKVGKIIRLLRIDEVPQLWNVLRGEMSLVGPRPERPFFVERFAEKIPLYRRRLHVKPGVTGWAQTKLPYDATVDDVKEKLKYDLYYIENMSLRFDLLILLRTVWVVLTGKGAR